MDTVFRVTDGVLEQYDGCSETVVIPDGIVVIGSGAFQDNKTITEVIMPDTVRAIRHDAFASCVKLKSVIFSKTLQTIDYNAFWGCKSLKSLELPDTLRALGSSVFAGCSKLTSLKCESEVFEMGSDPFTDDRCPASGSQLADEHGFLIFCGVLYAYYGTERDIVIPDGVKKIMNDVFRQNAYALVKKTEITSAVIPDSVTYIGNLAFKGCRTLRSVRMPEQVRLGTHVFAGCDGLANPDGFVICGGIACEFFGPGPHVHVTEGVRELSAEVFANRSIHTVSLPDSLVRIGDCAFEGCNLLERIVIPDSVKEIGSGAFRGCYHLSEVTLPDTVETMGDGVFAGCRGLADENGFVIRNRALHAYFGSEPEIVVPEGVTGIASGVFYKSDVVSVQLPSTLKTLGSAFSQCRRLTEIVIPEGVTKICNGTFSGCDQLTRVVLPESLTQIGSDAFHGCSALREIRIPDGVTSIGSQAFADCEALSEITIPKGVKLLNYRIFNSCTALKTVHLPDGLRAIDSEAFHGCTGLETLTIPDTVEKYGLSVFARCSNLKSLHCTIRGTVEGNPFEDCAGLVDADGYTVVGGILWKCINGKEHAVIPEGVTAIARDVFREGRIGSYKFAQIKRAQGTLKSVTFPSTLKQIYEGAFEGCRALEQITLPEGLVMLGEESFCDCTALKEIVVPDRVEKIRKSAFSGCTALQRIHLPASVADLSADLFRGCESLVAIEVDADNPRYSSRDGMLFNKAADTLLCVPGGLKLKEFTVPQGVSAIGNRALIDCTELRKVVIPETVKRIGFEVFVRVPPVGRVRLSEIEVAPNAGSEEIGSNVFDFQDCDRPLVYPRLPVTFVKEPPTQIALALGFCMHPERYEGVYAEGYRKFALSHQKTLMKKAQLLKLKEVEAYFASVPGAKAASADGGYRPDLSVKKPSDLRKVEILEETVRKGTLEDLNAVLKTYKPFEMTARALGLAARYRGIDFVRALVAQGAKFRYEDSPAMIRKYAMQQKTVGGCYNTDYALMLVPEHLFLREHTERGDNWYEYEYTPLCGVKAMYIPDELEARVLPMEQRVEIAVYLDGCKNLGASADEMLFWALTKNELAFADALIERGVDLQKTPPTYYRWSSAPSYLEIITTGKSSIYWTNYTTDLSKLEEKQLLPVLERLCALAARAQKKPVLSQKMYDNLHWNDASLSFALQNFDVSKVNQKKALEAAILNNRISVLSRMADSGWLSQTTKREQMIAFAAEKQCHEALAWLMDFKKRTVDVAAEAAKEEAKLMREFTEKPDSVSAMKRIWSYQKNADGTLQITSYKGSDTQVEIPSVIGKAAVTSIGVEAFSAYGSSARVKNLDVRRQITSVVIPEGVTEIRENAFFACDSLETVQLPGTLKEIGSEAFSRCTKLKNISIPNPSASFGRLVFRDCPALTDENGFVIVSGVMFGYCGTEKTVTIPDGVTVLAPKAFGVSGSRDKNWKIKHVILPQGLRIIGERVFESMSNLKAITIPESVEQIRAYAFFCSGLEEIELHEGLKSIGDCAFMLSRLVTVQIPKTVRSIGNQAFSDCNYLRDLYIPSETDRLGKELLGNYDSDDDLFASHPSGIYVHTPSGSKAEAYMKQYSGVRVANE